jgi:YegS/Rv2252/BmrU family lipid kinase
LNKLKTKILFIINPISGGKAKLYFPELAKQNLDRGKFEAEFMYSEFIGHANQIAAQALNDNIDIIAAVGGDGTINEIASALESTNKIMGIIPFGSGNGLARALRIPINTKAAIKKLNELQIQYIDCGVFNERKFFNMAGLGFDAHISSLFSKKIQRGFGGYVKTTLSEIATYRSEYYKIEIDGKQLEREAFMISIANSSQFGNNAHVSPTASVIDGLLDLCIIKPFPLYHFPVMGYHMFSKTADKSKYVEILKGKKIRIFRKKSGAVHVDGEPMEMGTELNIEVKPSSLALLI